MAVLLAEFTKLKRSLSWVVVVLLPTVLVLTGSVMTLIDGRGLEDGWHTLWMRSFVFPGLFPMAVGIAILASLSWRVEHRGSSWNALMAGPTSSRRVVLAKATVIAVLAVLMQVIAVISVVVLGKLAFGLPGWLPPEYLLICALVMLACVPVAAVQSGLSMLIRSFAGPVALGFLFSGLGVVLLLMGLDAVVLVSPYATLSRATQLGTGTFADTGEATASVIGMIVAASLLLSIVILAISTALLDRRDVRT